MAYTVTELDIRAELAKSTGEIPVNNKRITGVGTPVAVSDVVNKEYVDLLTASSSSGFRGQGNTGADATGEDYTAILDDAGKLITMNRATAQTATIPTNASVAFTAFTNVLTWAQIGDGAFTITAADGVTLILPPGKTAVSNGVGAVVSAVKLSTNTWLVYGDLVPS